MTSSDKNCRNCGAPLTRDGDCEYCGTRRQYKMTSGIEMTANRITLFVDDRGISTYMTGDGPGCRIERGYGT